VLLEEHSIHLRTTSLLFNLASHKRALLHTGVSGDIAVLFAGQWFYEVFTKIDMNATFFLLGTRDSPLPQLTEASLCQADARISLPNRVPDAHDQGGRFVGRSPSSHSYGLKAPS
jgi:hypothetical protein